ncbi:MAG: hypothetical protein OK422_01285 [Thaumarchaeota archaeon]|nr:hypothetical protein [Nitrososphaerota archaeon]
MQPPRPRRITLVAGLEIFLGLFSLLETVPAIAYAFYTGSTNLIFAGPLDVIFIFFFLFLSIGALFVGAGIWRRKAWARNSGLGLALAGIIFGLLTFGSLTVLALVIDTLVAYNLWRKETREYFERPSKPSDSSGSDRAPIGTRKRRSEKKPSTAERGAET